jgi:hypothetical protein
LGGGCRHDRDLRLMFADCRAILRINSGVEQAPTNQT